LKTKIHFTTAPKECSRNTIVISHLKELEVKDLSPTAIAQRKYCHHVPPMLTYLSAWHNKESYMRANRLPTAEENR
jgi:hypothetical protein